MIKRNIVEAASLVSAPTDEGTWRVRLINEGRGSSGTYSAELLESYGHAFNGAISFLNHPADGPEARNFTEIVGRVVGETWTERDKDGTLGVYANWEPDEDYKRKLEKYRENLGLSIYISGSGEEDENGDFRVTEFDASDPFRSVDVVIAAGRGGRFELTESVKKMYESRRSDSNDASTTAVGENKDDNMELSDVVKAVEALTTQVSALVAARNEESETSAQRQADAQAVEAAVSAYDSAVKAIDEAELLGPQIESLRARAARGEDVTDAIVEAKAVKEAALVEAGRISESAGRDFGGDKKEFNPIIEGWTR